MATYYVRNLVEPININVLPYNFKTTYGKIVDAIGYSFPNGLMGFKESELFNNQYPTQIFAMVPRCESIEGANPLYDSETILYPLTRRDGYYVITEEVYQNLLYSPPRWGNFYAWNYMGFPAHNFYVNHDSDYLSFKTEICTRFENYHRLTDPNWGFDGGKINLYLIFNMNDYGQGANGNFIPIFYLGNDELANQIINI